MKMYVIVNIAGKQFRVSEGASLKVPSLPSEEGERLEFGQVLLADDGKTVKVGNPVIKDASVSATITAHGRDRKVLVYKKKRRKGYQRKNGHRQGYTMIEINKITLKKPAAKKKAPKKPTAKKTKENK